jgi:tetratricopeptide (TPR) repeat protein
MNIFCRFILITSLAIASVPAIAQDTANVTVLVNQGVALNDQGKYADAVTKYTEALKLDPENVKANYEMAFTLSVSGKGSDGIPYIEKAIKGSTNTSLTAACYEVLGSIYDDTHQTQKAIDAYKEGIKIKPDYQRLYFNLGITYSRNKQYSEAEANAIKAIQLDPKHASSQRLYALVAFHQDKRVNALEAFCSFIMLEPNTARTAEAYGNIQHILQGGVLKDASGRNAIILSPKDNQENQTLNMAISMATLAGQSKKLQGMDLLEYELKAIFGVTGELAEKKTDKSFFDKGFAAYFYQLSKSNNMPAFTRLLSMSANKDENGKWMADHADMVKELSNWIMNTPRDLKGE